MMAPPLKLGIAGLGTVGAELVRLLRANRDQLGGRCGRLIHIAGVCARDRGRGRGVDLSGYAWFDDPVTLATERKVDVFVELIGGEEGAARASVEAALGAGTHVVTANKALLATHGAALAAMAEQSGVALNYEAAVAAAIPVVKVLREGLAGNRMTRVSGILNGTCNYILTVMEREQREFDDVLAEAQALGYAEADPEFDIGGHDTAHKLAILTSLAFATRPALGDVYIEGITKVTLHDIRAVDQLGYRIKLLGVAQDTGNGIEQRVHPTLVSKSSPIADVGGAFNAIVIEADAAGSLMLEGQGAGAAPTVSAVISDIVDIACGGKRAVFGTQASDLATYQRARMRAHEGGYYIGLKAHDRPGAVAGIAKAMADQSISLESIIQRADPDEAGDVAPDGESRSMPVALVTHETNEAAIRTALETIRADGHIAEPPHMIRIEQI